MRDMPEHQSVFGDLIQTRVRVLTWNLWHRFGPWKERQPAIAATLEHLDPDIACCQEVWVAGGERQAETLAGRLGFHHVFASQWDDDAPEQFGNAILSRWPILRTEWRPLPAPDDANELRTVVFAEIDGPRGPIQVFCTHLNWRFDQSAVRQEQARFVAQFVDDCKPRASFPPVVCGDLNAEPTSDEIRLLTGKAAVPVERLVFHDSWEQAGARDGDPGYTWSNRNPYAALDLEPDRRIDYVLVGWPKAGGAGHAVSCRVVGTDAVDSVVPSDHYGVLAELRY
jgi:endonuclease/exonuclease/phosphatase family metal-dependent hydrolase